MEIKITVKQLGKKHPLLKEKSVEINHKQSSILLKDLLALIVEEQVLNYNKKTIDFDENDTTHEPQKNYLELLSTTGKAGFGNIYNEATADLEKAKNNVFQSFEDGIIAVFQGEEELTSLDQNIDLSLNSPFTFIRLTFLAGSFW
ncbi:hypothetical protein [uncultured Flavobacterium sp.]|uniref:hypothetical protein n=1 Tax=uncultured Flavobacterium sp. TaxID=165435 RepID=UPI0025CD218F|nr:hypothetical protein [uncultured Flavobacterium sp.]